MMFLFFVLSLAFVACDKIEFELPTEIEIDEEVQVEDNSPITLTTSTGFKSAIGQVYVQKDLSTGLKVTSNTSYSVTSATWTIEGFTYEGAQIWHKFTDLGEITISVTAVLSNGTTESKTFTIVSVMDISEGDPVKVFVTPSGDNWNVLFLLRKERVRHATDTNFYYNGSITNWEQVAISPADKRYIINSSGLPQRVNDVGKYIGVNLTMSSTDNGEYNMALIHSGDNWADFSGSAFIRQDNPGLLHFLFENGVITAQGEAHYSSMPGATGDNYFRFEQSESNLIMYFKLDNNYTSSAFVVRQLDGGAYSSPIEMWSVSGHSQWGQIQIPIEDVQGKVLGLRYGPNSSQSSSYAKGMRSSFFYDNFFKQLRLSVINL